MPIPTVDAAKLALAPYLLYIKLAFVLLVAAAVFAAGWRIGSGLEKANWQHAAEQQAKAYRKSLDSARAAERASYHQRDEVSRELQANLASVRAERDRLRNQPARVVRVYVPAPAAGGVPPTNTPASGRNGASPGATPPAATLGPDIGQSLYDLADDGDEREATLRAQLKACQNWAAAR